MEYHHYTSILSRAVWCSAQATVHIFWRENLSSWCEKFYLNCRRGFFGQRPSWREILRASAFAAAHEPLQLAAIAASVIAASVAVLACQVLSASHILVQLAMSRCCLVSQTSSCRTTKIKVSKVWRKEWNSTANKKCECFEWNNVNNPGKNPLFQSLGNLVFHWEIRWKRINLWWYDDRSFSKGKNQGSRFRLE